MNCYSKRCINWATLIIALVIFIQINYITVKLLSMKNNTNSTVELKISKLEEDLTKINGSIISSEAEEWKLEIPKINLLADIKDGTEVEIINSYIGHFKETSYIDGNIGLAAHNAGYKENYFENLYKLEKGDVIKYKKGNIEKEYKVTENKVIDETNWTYLRNTQDNRITLITCITDNPKQRRCVQAVEVK